MPLDSQSYIALRGQRKVLDQTQGIIHIYPRQYDPGENDFAQLEFALKYEGVNLELLAAVFARIDPGELTQFVQDRPKSKVTRRVWYLYEMLTGERLAISDLALSVTYADLLDPEQYYTAAARPSRRHKVNDNLLGDAHFCPIIRRTPRLEEFIAARLDERCRELLRHYPEEVLHRALDYLFTKETKSSFAIEHITVERNRAAGFVSLLRRAGMERFLNKDALIGLQRATVDERFAAADWRHDQNYVGMTLGYEREQVHYVAPRPDDVPSLMEGLFAAAERMLAPGLNPVLIAGAISFGFVFIHPFDDGNGRLHRFLIHHLLAKTGFTPEGMIFPVSAVMVQQRARYDALLETFSKPLMVLVDYTFTSQGEMQVLNDTARFYRYPDMTRIAEGLFEFIQETLETELPGEMQFLVNYDKARRSMQEVVDMPDRLIDLFIRICLQNNGKLSKAKRESQFGMLRDEEVENLENCFREAFKG